MAHLLHIAVAVLVLLCLCLTAGGVPAFPQLDCQQPGVFVPCEGQNTLYLSQASLQAGMPDLKYLGYCNGNSTPYMTSWGPSTAISDFGLIVNIGPWNMNISMQDVIDLYFQTTYPYPYFRFQPIVAVAGDSYAVFVLRQAVRALFMVHFLSIDNSTGTAKFVYSVKMYETYRLMGAAPGFSWMATDNATCST